MPTFVAIEQPAPRSVVQSQSSAGSSGVTGWILAVLQVVEEKLEKRSGRMMLLEMTDAQLKDIGISRAEADGEASKPVWS